MEAAIQTISRLAAATLLGAVLLSGAPAAQRDSARVYVTVLDGDKPAKGLTAADFVVKEDGAARTVMSAAVADAPLAVEILTDRFGLDNTYSVFDVRLALTSIAHTLQKANPDSTFALMTFDGAAVTQVKASPAMAPFDQFVKTLFPNNQSPVLLEAIYDASQELEKATTDRRIVFAVYAGYRGDQSSTRAPTVIGALHSMGVALWTLEGQSTATSDPGGIDRQQVTDLAGPASGGFHESVRVGTALEGRGKALAGWIVGQYAVTYGAPDPKASKLEVSVSRPKLKVLAPTWTR